MIKTIIAAALLAFSSAAVSAEDSAPLPIFPDTGGELCCCPTAWIIDNGGQPFCQIPPGVGLIALPEAEDKARTERMQAIEARDHGAHPYSGHGR